MNLYILNSDNNFYFLILNVIEIYNVLVMRLILKIYFKYKY